MKIEFNYYHQGQEKRKFLPVNELVEMIRSGKYAKSVAAVREEVHSYVGVAPDATVESASRLPYVVWGHGEDGYTGLVMLSLPVSDENQMEELRKIVNAYLHVVCSFTGSSGRSLKVIMAFDNKDADDEALFHANAYSRAASFVQANTGIAVNGKSAAAGDGCRISDDANVFFNENVVPIIIPKITKMPDAASVHDIESLQPKRSLLPGYSEVEMAVARFNMVRRSLQLEADGDDTEIINLAEACAKADIEEEIAVKCTLSMGRFAEKELLVRSSFERAYESVKPLLTAPGASLPKSAVNIELMHRFLKKRYRFRQNELTGSVEYAELSKYVPSWKPFTERDRNTISIEALRAGIEIWDRDISRYVNSTLIETFDPISEWISTLPRWDGKDRVGELAATVKTDWELWPEMFRTWLRSMVSQWRGINRMYGATMVLMLTGAQGTRKSSFCKRILPPELMAYYVDRIDFTNKKDAERALIRFCLINLDEFDQISPRQTAFLKHILQKSDVTYRKMYQDDIEQRRRYAAFCATTNSETPLTDPTGSRRYLVVDVLEPIDTSYQIDYEQLYAQVLDEIRHDLPTYFDSEMERLVQQHNANYMEEIPLATMFANTFVAAKQGREDVVELTPTEVLIELKEKYRSGITVSRSSATHLGKLLANQGIRTISKEAKRVYRLCRK